MPIFPRRWWQSLFTFRVRGDAPRRNSRSKGPVFFKPRLEVLEDRTAPSFSIPSWVDQGPGPITAGQTEGLTAQSNPVAGAVELQLTMMAEISPGVFIERIDESSLPPADSESDTIIEGPSELNGNGLEFQFNPASGMNPQAIAGFQAAAALWSGVLHDDVRVVVNINFTNLGAGILGSTSSTSNTYTYSAWKAAMTSDSTSADDATAVANLPSGSSFKMLLNRTANNPNGAGSATPYLDNDGDANNTTMRISRMNARALGLIAAGATGTDASISFSNQFTWDFDRSNGITAGAYDFVGVAAHEIGHALGFISGVDILDTNSSGPFSNDNAFTYVSGPDMFRYSAASVAAGGAGTIDWTASTAAKNFSINGGTTLLTPTFSTGTTWGDGRQASHWKDNLGIGIMDPTASTGELLAITANDIKMFDVIGWNNVAIPTGAFADGGFESPAVGAGAFQYNPSGSAWSFAGGAGLSGNGSAFTAGNPNAPQGAQVAFLQNGASITQAFQVAAGAAGNYTVSFQAAQRGNHQPGGNQVVRVLVDGVERGQLTPVGISYGGLTTAAFALGEGAHTLTLQGLGVGDSTAFLDAVAIALITTSPGALADGGFESPALGAGAFQYAPSGSAWAFAGLAGLSSNGSLFTVGNPSAPQGGQVAFLQEGGSVSQSFQVAAGAAGNYTVSFQAAQRGNHQPGGNQVVRVLVDGIERGQLTPVGISYGGLTTAAFALGEGAHTLTLQGLGVGDSTAFLDAVELTRVTQAATLTDGGFESPSMGAGTGAYQYTPSGSAWAFVGEAGLSGNGSLFTVGNPSAPQGGQVAFLQNSGSVSQTFQIAAGSGGSYTISFQAAQRGNHQPGGNQVVRVLVDGVERGRVTPTGTSYGGFTTAAFGLGEGAHTLTLEGLGVGDSTAFLDALALSRVG